MCVCGTACMWGSKNNFGEPVLSCHSAVESGGQGLDLGDQASTLSAERSQWPSSQCEVRSLSILSARLLFL